MTKPTVLVLGSGGREHALCWRLAKDGVTVMVTPGNPGLADVAELVPAIDICDGAAVVALAQRVAADLVVIGPEAPLVAGVADQCRAAGIAVFGPNAKGALLEGSKAFAKQFFAANGIRTAPFRVARTVAEAHAAVDELGGALVVKADGLAAGKGVVVCGDAAQAKAAAADMLTANAFGAAGATVVIERRIMGREVSVLAITDGKSLEVLAPAEDHKTIFDDDRGPNTGGMGTACPAWPAPSLVQRIVDDLLAPTVTGLAAAGLDYRGVLYAGVMVDAEGVPWLLEYNCRFGDPETQSILVRAEGNFYALLAGAAAGALPAQPLGWQADAAICVVIAAANYPAAPRLGDVIHLPAPAEGVVIFHAGTKRAAGQLVSAGGRVLGVTARGATLEDARQRAYAAVAGVALDGMQFRRDIGARKR